MDSLFSFFDKNSIYVVLVIVLSIWLGIYFSLLNIDKRLKKIELEIEKGEKPDEE